MCGISGIITSKENKPIEAINALIAHRGPDDVGIYIDKNIAFGQRRLAIQDLSPNGHQPMVSADGRYVINFNGEIYNHREIREPFKDKYPFKSTGDTETVLYGFIEYGTALFNQLNGIFALAIYDTQTQAVVLARDQFGIKPLYYYQKDGVFLFASEIKAFLAYAAFDKTVDIKALVNYIHFLWSPGEQTPFEYVKKLLPGHYIRLNAAESNHNVPIEPVCYYDIPFNGQYDDKTETEWIEALDHHLYKAVERQLLSDVPVGFFLSGGLDSSTIVAMAKRILPNQRLQCYTIDAGSEDTEAEGFSDDLTYAQKVAAHLDVDLHIVNGKLNILADFDKMVYHLDEPQADVAPLHVLNICKQARADGRVVLLGGTAGDDLFSGYRRHQALNYEKFFKYIPVFCIRCTRYLLRKMNAQSPKIRRLRKVMRELDKSKLDRFINYFSWVSAKTSKELLHPALQAQIKDYNPQDILRNALHNIPEETSDLNKMLYLELKYFLTDHNLNYTDKLSMATGVEVRVPFLDKELVEFSTKIPPTLKMKGMTTKYLLRKVMERYLTYDVIYRKKAGFGAPVRKWVTHDLDEKINRAFSKESIEKQGLFNYDKVWEIIRKNKAGQVDGSYTILSLLSIQSWYSQFVGNAQLTPVHEGEKKVRIDIKS